MLEEDAFGLVEAGALEVADVVEDDGGGEEEGVEAVEEAAVAGEGVGPVFDAQVVVAVLAGGDDEDAES